MQFKSVLSLLVFVCSSHPLSAAPISGINLENFDHKVRFQDDLNAAVNGHWEKKTDIPADQSAYGVFNQLRDLSESRSHILIEQRLNRERLSPDEQKIRDLYVSYMRVSAIDAQGIQPILPDLQRIDGLNTPLELARRLGKLQRSPLNLPLRLSVQPDAQQASSPLLQISQGGLGLPDRDYYLQNDRRFVAARQAYLQYLETLFSNAGLSSPLIRARSVLAFETRLARAQSSAVDNRDPGKTYTRVSLGQLQRMAPAMPWRLFLNAADLASVTQVNLVQPDYVRQFAEIQSDTPIALWRDYLRARTLEAYAPFLSQPFVNADFVFRLQALSGIKQQRQRWKRGISLVEAGMGQALGKLYVAQYFPPEAKQQIDQLVENLMQAYRQSIESLDWMSAATKKQALVKLAKYQVKIGYPSHWKDYSTLNIRPHDLVGNLRRISAFNYRSSINKLGKPIDRTEWQMTPQTVNAYYDAQFNEIVFPAAILQPPFFNPQADNAVNYGAIGAVIGHEISHGFDDEGSQYDGDGNLRNWWSASDRAQFKARSDKLVAQYASYEPLPGYHVNGQLTLGENIADNAGLQIAYKAYRLSLNGAKPVVIDGLSGDQRFFIGFAQSWRSKMQDAQLLKQLVSNPHTPSHFRARGAAVNTEAFYQAFGVKPSDKMFKPESERVRLW